MSNIIEQTMKKRILPILFTGILCIVLSSCNKDDNADKNNRGVELYLLASYETVGNSFQIDKNSVITETYPLIEYSDFLSYNPDEYVFEITEETRTTLEDMGLPVDGLAFGVKANGELIYTGYFWPAYSSIACNWFVIDVFMSVLGNELKVDLGYPGYMEEQEIEDNRNDPRILYIFQKDNKLIR
jgi:hypothetical protein